MIVMDLVDKKKMYFGGLRGLHLSEIPMEDILFGIIENMSKMCPTCTVQVGDE